jgi:uncharacterized protein YutE (UPF0331/DUF86 family)
VIFDEQIQQFLRWLRWPSNATNLYRVSFWILLAIIAGLIAVFANLSNVVWGLAALGCGGLLGFLFGIPRVEQGFAHIVHGFSEPEGGTTSKTAYRQTVNTNLTEISDWLTKIIVGVSLMQMTQIPRAFESLVLFLSGSKYDPGFVGGILVFFGVSGFLSGYLLTRLFLATAFSEADRAANDFNLKSTRLPLQLVREQPGETPDFIKRSPLDAVLTSWGSLYDAATNAIRSRRPNIRTPRLANTLLRDLVDLGIFDESQAKIFDDLRKLRNIAAHSSEAINEEAATDYVTNARALINSINSAAIAKPGAT